MNPTNIESNYFQIYPEGDLNKDAKWLFEKVWKYESVTRRWLVHNLHRDGINTQQIDMILDLLSSHQMLSVVKEGNEKIVRVTDEAREYVLRKEQ